MYSPIKIVQIILEKEKVHCFIQKIKQLILMQVFLMIITLNLLKAKAKLLRNTVPHPNSNQANEILRNTTIFVPLKI